MARKAAGRRCPSCGADVATQQKFCTRCGVWLEPDKRAGGSRTASHVIGKVFAGLLVLALVFGLANRFLLDNDPAPTPLVEVASNSDPPPTHTPILPSSTAEPHSPTTTRQPESTRTPKPVSTHTPSPVPTVEPVFTELASLKTAVATQAAKAGDTFAPTETSTPRKPTRIPDATEIPATATQPPTLAALYLSPTQVAVVLSPTPPVRTLASTDCSGYDAWEWAQSVYDSNPAAYATLDPDRNGVACDGLGPGFAPAFWTTGLPDGVEIGTVSYLVDGDTYEIVVDGQSARYRLYHADTPETYDPVQCGGAAATEFARYVLQFSDTPQQVWIESTGQRDKYGRKLAYIWITIAGDPYLLNHVLINNGWAEDIDYNDAFDPYKSELRAAANFAKRHTLGVWAQCGGFGVPLVQPTQPLPTTAAVVIQPTQHVQAQMSLSGNCDPNYTPCVPDVSYDLDCKDIGFRVHVIGYDRHRFDADGDGAGCESW